MVLYFSGTGNSAFVAKRIAEMVQDEVLDLFPRLREQDTSPIHSERPFVIVAPTYAWQLPHIVRDWMKRTAFTGSKSFYFVLTCGMSIGNAGHYAKALCREIQVCYMGCAQVVMPENYIAAFPVPAEDEAGQIVDRALPTIRFVAERIKNEDVHMHKAGLFSKILSGAVNRFFYRSMIKDKKFIVSDACIHCAKCAAACPTKNIEMKNGKPHWTGRCIHCMKCICDCPVFAIEYGKKSLGKPRYHCPYE